MEIVIASVVGIAAFAAGWFAATARGKSDVVTAARTIAALEASLDAQQRASQQQLAQYRATTEAQLTYVTSTANQQATQTQRLHDQQLAQLRQAHAEQLQGLRDSLQTQFEAMTSRVLEKSTATLLSTADERLKRAQAASDAELAKREAAVAQLVKPIEATLDKMQKRVESAETDRTSAHAVLHQQLREMKLANDELTNQTRKLATSLRSSGTSGRWGELQLRRIVEAAGMLPNVSYEEQFSVTTPDGTLRPDMVVHLPGDKDIVIDAKVSVQDYLDSIDTETDAERSSKLASHARHVRKHVDELAAKAYWDLLPRSPEFVVMFMPAEPFLQVALERDPDLLEHAMSKNIVVATPATLLAVLRTIAYTWRQEQLAREAQAVLDAGKELHKRLGTLGGHLQTLAKRLNGSVEAFNQFNSSFDRNVVTQAKKLAGLQLLAENVAEAPPLEVLAVPAQKPDFYVRAITATDGEANGSDGFDA